MSSSPNYYDDPAFPTLALALDTSLMVSHLAPLIAEEGQWSISGCRLLRLRYRRGVRCILHYAVTVRHESGVESEHWVTGFLYATREKLAARLQHLQRISSQRVAGEPLARFVEVANLGMLLQRFPLDHRLPDVLHISEQLPELLQVHAPDLFGPGDWRMQTLAAQPVRWRVGISAVVRARVAAVNQESAREVERDFYVKVDHSEAASAEVTPHALIESHARQGSLPFTIADSIYRDPSHGLSVTAAVPGISLQALFEEQRATHDEAVQLAETVARWQLHGESLHRCVRSRDKEANIERARVILHAAAPHLTTTLDRLVTNIREGLVDHVHRPAHLDLKPDHIFYHDGQLALIDFDSAADADPALEVGRFVARLSHAEPVYNVSQRCARRFAVQFVAAYRALVPAAWLRNLPYYYAWGCMQVAVHLFEHQKSNWPEWLEVLLTHAEEASRHGGVALDWLEEPLPRGGTGATGLTLMPRVAQVGGPV